MWKSYGSDADSASAGDLSFENDMLALQYTDLLDSVKLNYYQMSNVTYNQAHAIASNWGRLKAYHDEVSGYVTGKLLRC